VSNILYNITVTSPDGTATIDLIPTSIDITGDLNEATALHAVMEYGWSWYEDEDSASNPLQCDSWIIVYRNVRVGSTWSTVIYWQGYIPDRHLIQRSGERIIEFTAYDLIARLSNCRASVNGDPIFTRTTPAVELSNVVLKKAAAIGDALFPYYPTPSDTDPWIPKASCNDTVLYTDGIGTDLTIGAKTIIAQATQEGMLPLGLIQIDNEWIQYDGYDYNISDDRYRFKGCTRGALGTTAATHAEGSTIYQRISQAIHPIAPINMQGNLVSAPGTWETIRESVYAVQPEEGRFDFSYDPIVTHIPGWTHDYSAVRATYAVFDEDNANALDLKEILDLLLSETILNGGPGLVSGSTFAVDALLANIKISRVRNPKSTDCLNFIRNLIDELGLNKGETEDTIGIWYDHPNSILRIAPITQKTAALADHHYANMVLIDRDISIEKVYSAVEVTYNSGQNENLASSERMWHPEVGDDIGDTNPDPGDQSVVCSIDYQDVEAPMVTGWVQDQAAVGNNVHTERLVDAYPWTGWGMTINPVPVLDVDVLYGWLKPDNAGTADTPAIIDEV
jgi:hypothetical protein